MNHQTPASSLDRFFTAGLDETDPELAAAIAAELGREQDGIELIASENIVSRAVLEAQGSVLTNKYAEGYPGRRYYGGCQARADKAETLAIERAKQAVRLRLSPTCNPIPVAQANQAVFLALAPARGHHPGHVASPPAATSPMAPAPNLSGKWFRAVQYGVRRDDGLLDYEELAALATRRASPKLIIAGGSCLSPHHRLRPHPRRRRRNWRSCSWWTWRISPAWSPPASTPAPIPHAHVTTHHHP